MKIIVFRLEAHFEAILKLVHKKMTKQAEAEVLPSSSSVQFKLESDL